MLKHLSLVPAVGLLLACGAEPISGTLPQGFAQFADVQDDEDDKDIAPADKFVRQPDDFTVLSPVDNEYVAGIVQILVRADKENVAAMIVELSDPRFEDLPQRSWAMVKKKEGGIFEMFWDTTEFPITVAPDVPYSLGFKSVRRKGSISQPKKHEVFIEGAFRIDNLDRSPEPYCPHEKLHRARNSIEQMEVNWTSKKRDQHIAFREQPGRFFTRFEITTRLDGQSDFGVTSQLFKDGVEIDPHFDHDSTEECKNADGKIVPGQDIDGNPTRCFLHRFKYSALEDHIPIGGKWRLRLHNKVKVPFVLRNTVWRMESDCPQI